MSILVSVLVAALATLLAGGAPPLAPAVPRVSMVRLPAGAIQPQTAVDARGIVHVVYFTGEAAAGDLFYAQFDGKGFTGAIRVNSVPASAIAAGSVRGAQLAVGRAGHVHVAWNGSKPVELNGAKRTPMWYARSSPDGKTFEPQRDVSGTTRHIDGGGSIAADDAGSVHVAWHAEGASEGEASRTVYVARSTDDGATFGKPRSVTRGTGACACCGMRAVEAPGGRIHVLYRTATDGVHRDTAWASFAASSKTASIVRLHPWELRQCPMSTFALVQTRTGLVAAWETQQQIYSSTLDPVRGAFSAPIAMGGTAPRKHPSVAVNATGVRLVAWAEGTAWKRGGMVAWEMFDPDGASLASGTDAGEVPVWGLLSVVPRPDGSFVILH